MDITKLLGNKTESVWDKYVPIITTDRHVDAYITDGIEDPATYNELCHVLRTSHKGDTITLYLNTPGGMVDSAFMIVDAIKASKARVTAYLSGTVASAGTIIALSCDKVEAADHTSFMAHNYSGGLSGKGHEMKARQEFMDSSLNTAFKEFYAGFYTDNEMQEIIDGKDSWLGKNEILQRWDNRVQYLKDLKKPSA